MKRFSQVIVGFVILGLAVACTPASTPGGNDATGGANTADRAIAPTIDEFDFDEIAGGGCGMTLWRTDRSPQDRRYVLFNGLVQQSLSEFDVSMEMKIDDRVVTFSRTAYQGESFAVENYPQQTFVSNDGTLIATVAVDAAPAPEVTGGASSGETEVVAITEGTVTVSRQGQTTQVAVVGDAGC